MRRHSSKRNASEIQGTAQLAIISIGTVDGALLFWCNQHRVATLVDMKKGDVVRKLERPSVTRLMADDLESGGLVAWSDDGRIERLSPVAKPAAVAAKPADSNG